MYNKHRINFYTIRMIQNKIYVNSKVFFWKGSFKNQDFKKYDLNN